MTHQEAIEYAAYLQTLDLVLYGERVIVVPDEAGEYVPGSKTIVAPDSYKRRPKTGIVVMLGQGLLRDAAQADDDTLLLGTGLAGLRIGDRVVTNVYNTLALSFPSRPGDPDAKPVVVQAFHAADIYVGHRHDIPVNVEEIA
jgi:hypothetical protein